METSVSATISPDLSTSGLGVSGGTSNFIEIDVESALRELAGSQTPSPPPGSEPQSETSAVSAGNDQADASSLSDEEIDAPVLDPDVRADEVLSGESSDSDVIHIDLTQRPPPLPMSGLALEQIVAMLPGTTYSLAGSGVPLRTSPRSEQPRRPAPDATTGGPSAAATGSKDSQDEAAGADASREGRGSAYAQPQTSGSPPKRTSTGGPRASAGGGGGSPRVALTFIPGLGLVPVFIDDEDSDVDEGEEGEHHDEDGAAGAEHDGRPWGFEDGGGLEAAELFGEHSDDSFDGEAGGLAGDDDDVDDVAAPAVAFSGQYGDDDDSDDLEAAAASFSIRCDQEGDENDNTDDNDDVTGDEGTVADSLATFGGRVMAISDTPDLHTGGADAGALRQSRGLAKPESPVPDVSEEGDVAVPEAGDSDGGPVIASMADVDLDADEDDDAASGGRCDVSEEQLKDIIQQVVHGLRFAGLDFEDDGLGDGADDGDEELEPGEAEAQHESESGAESLDETPAILAGFLGDHRSITAVYAPEAATGASDSEGTGEGEIEVDYGDEEGQEPGEDEVDDSGSGVGDEVGMSILGGLTHGRFAHAAEAASGLASYHTLELPASGLTRQRQQAPTGSAGAVLEPVRSPSASEDVHMMASRLQPQTAIAGSALPRPRYMPHSALRPYDAPQEDNDEVTDGNAASHSWVEAEGAPAPADVPTGEASEAPRDVSSEEPPALARAPITASEAVPSLALSARDFNRSLSGSSTSSVASSGGPNAGNGGGADLNSTMRTTGQSLAAIRQVALQAESARQAKFMAERLGGGAKSDTESAPSDPSRHHHHHHHHHHTSLPALSGSRPAISNPFGNAGYEASAAAGLIDVKLDQGNSNLNRSIRRTVGAGTGTGSGYATVDHGPHGGKLGAVDGADPSDLEDLLRDRPIIEPRYPTDTKTHQPNSTHQHHHSHHRHQSSQQTESGGAADEAGSDAAGTDVAGGDGGGGWRPRHRRSVELVDLDKLASDQGDKLMSGTSPGQGGGEHGSEDGNSPTSPTARSLLTTRKSDDGRLAMPAESQSPRLEEEDDSDSGSTTTTSSAHSVADERLVDELEALREELGQKTTLVAGLRGELRKYTDLAMRLEHQLSELRNQADPVTKAAARSRSQSDAGFRGSSVGSLAPSTGPDAPLPQSVQPLPNPPASTASAEGASEPTGSSPQPSPAQPPSQSQLAAGSVPSAGGPRDAPGQHGLPPHPQSQGLEGPARLTLYREIVSQAQLQVGRSGGPAPPDLRDTQELLVGKDKLDAGTEKVMLIKLQKMLTWGCEAAWKASAAQHQARFLEQAAQQAAQARSALETERDQLKQALQAARTARSLPSSEGASAKIGVGSGEVVAGAVDDGLQEQLSAANDELAASRAQVSDLESAVASLNADVRKLKVQLRSSRDGSQQPAATEPDGSGHADAMAWNMERQMLLKTISGLERELESIRAGSPRSGDSPTSMRSLRRSSGEGLRTSAEGLRTSGEGADLETAKRAVLADAALDRVQQLQGQLDAAATDNAELRRQLREAAVAAPGVAKTATEPPQVLQLQEELAAARERLTREKAESRDQVAACEEECALLRLQVVELRQELAGKAADAAAAVARLQEEKRGLETVLARKEEDLGDLRKQLQEAEQLVRERRDEQGCSSRDAREHGLQGEAEAADRIEALETEMREQTREAESTIQALSQALKIATADRDQLQQLLDARGRELAQAETQLGDVRAAVSQLQAEASEMQAQVAELQSVLEREQRGRKEAEAKATEARAEAEAAEERACDAHAASLLAETALGRALEEVEALTSRVGGLEEENEQAREDAADLQSRLQVADEDLTKLRAGVEELRAYSSELETEARDLRTALSAEDSVQVQLRGQVECLESELEAQVSVAQRTQQRAAKVEAALAAAEVRRAAADAVEAEVAAEQRRAAELEAKLSDAQEQLAEALRRYEEAAGQADDLQSRLEEVLGRAEQAERRLQDAEAQMEVAAAVAAQRSPSHEPRQRQAPGDAAYELGKTVAEARLAALENQLRAAEVDREAMRQEVAALLKQLGSSAQLDAFAAAPAAPPLEDQAPSGRTQPVDETEAATLRAERALLLADCARLQSELALLRVPDAGSGGALSPPPAWRAAHAFGEKGLVGLGTGDVASARAEVEALREQLQSAQADLQGTRSELQVARTELVVKGELLAAKDLSLSTLQETVEALRVALQVTQQNLQMPSSSPRTPGHSALAGDAGASADKQLKRYQDTVTVLQRKFEESESIIRRLELQVAALETRVSPGDQKDARQSSPSMTAAPAGRSTRVDWQSSPVDWQSSPAQHRPQPEGGKDTVQQLQSQVQDKEQEISRLTQELEQVKKQLPAASRPASESTSGSLPSRGGSSNDPRSVSAATVSDLQMQLLQWRALGEDVHARYQSKKDVVRRLREQLAAEQQRHADEQARSKAQLEAACNRLGRLATELGGALRRCIALDLQSLSATTLTTSPRSQLGGKDVPEDINALAALLARQGAALIESLELALDQVTSAREERALLLAQLAHKQVVLEELRHHMACQAAAAPPVPDAAAAAAAGPASTAAAGGGGYSEPRAPAADGWPSQQGGYMPGRQVEIRQSPHAPTAAAALGASSRPPPGSESGVPEAFPKATTPTTATSPSKALHTATLNLAQDMAALSAQQAGLRSTLLNFEQRQAQQPKPRALSSVPFIPAAGAGGYNGMSPISPSSVGAASFGHRLPARHGSGGMPADGLSVSPSSIHGGMHSSGGRLSTGIRADVSPVTGMPISRPLVVGLYQQPTSPGAGAAASAQYDASGKLLPGALYASSSYLPLPRTAATSLGATVNAGASLGPAGAAARHAGGSGASGLSLSHERRMKFGDA